MAELPGSTYESLLCVGGRRRRFTHAWPAECRCGCSSAGTISHVLHSPHRARQRYSILIWSFQGVCCTLTLPEHPPPSRVKSLHVSSAARLKGTGDDLFGKHVIKQSGRVAKTNWKKSDIQLSAPTRSLQPPSQRSGRNEGEYAVVLTRTNVNLK